ncbi:hypothetical protein [Gordonibacter sp. RACS_AR49]|nr:hypothetical protein [Gordonibacter sp. RACS_AR49]
MANYFQSLEKRATTLPGMTAVSMLFDAAKVAGLCYEDLSAYL